MGDENEVDVTAQFNALLAQQNILLENSNAAKFEYQFTGNNHETLPWIFAAEKFLRVNRIKTPAISFQRIFASMHDVFQNRYLSNKDPKDDEITMTFESLKEWVLKEYPPPKTKYEFKQKLKSMLMFKGEDPNIAYSRYKYKLDQINNAIDAINKGIKAESLQLHAIQAEATKWYNSVALFKVSVEDRREALTRMFVIRNNEEKWNNKHTINERVRNFIIKKDPRTMDDWDDVFNKMKTQLIARVLDGQKQWEFITYPSNADDDNIYVKKHHLIQKGQNKHPLQQPKYDKRQKKRQTLNRKRGRRELSPRNRNRDGPPNKKLRPNTECYRCHRMGHLANKCYAEFDVNRQRITSPAPVTLPQCIHCKKTNHHSNQCKFKDATNKRENGNSWRKNKHQKYDKPPSKTKEINALKQKQSNKLSTKDLMAMLTKRISNNDKLDTNQQYDCLALLNNLNENISARQDESTSFLTTVSPRVKI